MFTAIVLVCSHTLAGDVNRENCFTYTSDVMYKTVQQCEEDVRVARKSNIFFFQVDEYTAYSYEDYRCINWDAITTSQVKIIKR